jgi:hypothetical protein
MGPKGHARAFARVPKVYFLSFVLPPFLPHLWSAGGGGGGGGGLCNFSQTNTIDLQ